MNDLFKQLRKEVKKEVKGKIDKIPFQSDWRKKLKNYRKDLGKEYEKKFSFLLDKLRLNNLKKIENKNQFLIFFLGFNGSGKNTTAEMIKGILKNTVWIDSHVIIDTLKIYDKKNLKKYVNIAKKYGFYPVDPWYLIYPYKEDLIKFCLERDYNVIIQSCIKTKKDRLGYYKLAKKFGAEVINIQIYVPFDICCKRILQRDSKKFSSEDLEKTKKEYAYFAFHGEDIDKEEEKLYKILKIDGTKSFKEIRQILTKFFSI